LGLPGGIKSRAGVIVACIGVPLVEQAKGETPTMEINANFIILALFALGLLVDIVAV
jgi:hypothetical protein